MLTLSGKSQAYKLSKSRRRSEEESFEIGITLKSHFYPGSFAGTLQFSDCVKVKLCLSGISLTLVYFSCRTTIDFKVPESNKQNPRDRMLDSYPSFSL